MSSRDRSEMRGLKDAKAWYQKGRQSSPNRHRRNDSFARSLTRLLAHKKEEGEEQTKERRERREERNKCKLDSLHFYRVAHGRDGREKGQARRDLSLESLSVGVLKLPNLAPTSHDSVPGSHKTCWAAAGGLFCFDIRRRLPRRRPQSARPRKTSICRSAC